MAWPALLDVYKRQVSGSVDLEQLEERLDIDLQPLCQDCDTLGGLIFSQMTTIPRDGSKFTLEVAGLRIRVEELMDRRVEWALVEKLPQSTPEAEPEEE